MSEEWAYSMADATLPPEQIAAAALGPEDLRSVEEPDAWLTDNAVRYLVLKERESISPHPSQLVNFADPSYLFEAGNQGLHDEIPSCFLVSPNSNELFDQVILPLLFNANHWITVHMNLATRKVRFYDTHKDDYTRRRVSRLLRAYTNTYSHCFKGDPNSAIKISRGFSAQQSDDSSCGLYLIGNSLNLLRGQRPITTPMTENDIFVTREQGADMIRAQMVLTQEFKELEETLNQDHLFEEAPLHFSPASSPRNFGYQGLSSSRWA